MDDEANERGSVQTARQIISEPLNKVVKERANSICSNEVQVNFIERNKANMAKIAEKKK